MTSLEYKDIFDDAQARDYEMPYRMLLFDVANSKVLKYDPYNLIDFMESVANKLEQDGVLYVPTGEERDPRVESAYTEFRWGWVNGDCRVICLDEQALRTYLNNDADIQSYFQALLDDCAEQSGLLSKMHWATGVFEDFRWVMGSDVCVFPYCIDLLGDSAKTNGLFVEPVA